MVNEVSDKVKALTESHKAVSKNVKALAKSNKAMNEELSRLQEVLKNMMKEELQSLNSTDQNIQYMNLLLLAWSKNTLLV